MENIRTKVECLRISDGGQRVRAAWGLGAQGGAERPWDRGQGEPRSRCVAVVVGPKGVSVLWLPLADGIACV